MIDVGSIAGWVAVVGVGIVAWLQYRGGGSTAVSVLRTTNEVLEHRVHEQDAQLRDARKMIEEMRALTDLTIVIRPVIDALIAHEVKESSRYEETTRVLSAIGDRLASER